MRNPTIFCASHSRSCSVSSGAIAASTSRPRPIAPAMFPSTVTDASLTRWMTARIRLPLDDLALDIDDHAAIHLQRGDGVGIAGCRQVGPPTLALASAAAGGDVGTAELGKHFAFAHSAVRVAALGGIALRFCTAF